MGMPTNDAMRQETQASICEWAEATFGLASSNARVAARANEEMAELLRALTTDENHPKAPEEAADVVIVLYRLAMRLGVELFVTSPWMGLPTASTVELAAIANEKMASLIRSIAVDDNYAAAGTIKVLVRYLSTLTYRIGLDLMVEVNKKMAVNRARQWNLDGTGHGRHVRIKQDITAQ